MDEGKLSWFLGRTHKDTWDMRYEALVEYGEAHGGGCNISQLFKCNQHGKEIGLGQWLRYQRQCKKNNNLNSDREAKLQKLVDEGKLSWKDNKEDARRRCHFDEDDAWIDHYNAVVSYGEEHTGDYNVTHSYKCMLSGKMVELGLWLNTQRRFKKENNLDNNKIAKLQRLVDEGKLNWSIGRTGYES